MKIAIDCDDAAVSLKEVLYKFIKEELEMDIDDLNFSSTKENALYPEIGYNLAKKVSIGEYDRGILLCGTGLGMEIIANKVKGVYAGSCGDVFSAERLRKSNNANVLTIGERVTGHELAKLIAKAFLTSDFAGGGSTPKVGQIKELENKIFMEEKNEKNN